MPLRVLCAVCPSWLNPAPDPSASSVKALRSTPMNANHAETVNALQRIFDPVEIVREHARITRPLLPESEWRSILHMSAAGLAHALPLLDLRSDCIEQRLHSRNRPLLKIDRRGAGNSAGERILRSMCQDD